MDDKLTTLIEQAKAVQPRLDDERAALKLRLEATDADEELVRSLFDLLVFADFNAVAMESAMPARTFGFMAHDARFLRSLRDQALGVSPRPRPLSRTQLNTLRVIMLREPYITQATLLATTA